MVEGIRRWSTGEDLGNKLHYLTVDAQREIRAVWEEQLASANGPEDLKVSEVSRRKISDVILRSSVTSTVSGDGVLLESDDEIDEAEVGGQDGSRRTRETVLTSGAEGHQDKRSTGDRLQLAGVRPEDLQSLLMRVVKDLESDLSHHAERYAEENLVAVIEEKVEEHMKEVSDTRNESWQERIEALEAEIESRIEAAEAMNASLGAENDYLREVQERIISNLELSRAKEQLLSDLVEEQRGRIETLERERNFAIELLEDERVSKVSMLGAAMAHVYKKPLPF